MRTEFDPQLARDEIRMMGADKYLKDRVHALNQISTTLSQKGEFHIASSICFILADLTMLEEYLMEPKS